MFNPLSYNEDDDLDEESEYTELEASQVKDPYQMTDQEREAAIKAFLATGKKITKCPPRAAKSTIWLGGRPAHVKGDKDVDPKV